MMRFDSELVCRDAAADLPPAERQPASANPAERWLGLAASAGLVTAVGLLAFACVYYLSQAAFVDHIESSVLIVGWQYLHGMPMYGLEGGAPHFATYYGPLTYLAPLPGMLLFGPGVTSAKMVFTLAPLGAVGLMAWHFRHHGFASMRGAVLLLASGLLSLGVPAFWVRPDPLEMLLVTVALVASSGVAGPMVVGLCLGLAVNLKIHAFLYLAPVMFDLLQRRGWSRAALAMAVSAVVFMLPFLLPGISLADYRFGLSQQVFARSVDPRLVVLWVYCSALLVISLLAGLATAGPSVTRNDKRYAWAAIGTAALLGYPGTFPGAGPYHLLPLIPVLAEAFGRLRPRHPAPALMPLVVLFVALGSFRHTVATIDDISGSSAAAREALTMADSARDATVQVGYGQTVAGYKVSQLSRTLLSLAGRPALIDGQVLMELSVIGIDGSRRWMPLVSDCRVATWLVPHGEQPFSLATYYGDAAMFSDGFRETFRARYHIERTGENFDSWRCNEDAGRANGG